MGNFLRRMMRNSYPGTFHREIALALRDMKQAMKRLQNLLDRPRKLSLVVSSAGKPVGGDFGRYRLGQIVAMSLKPDFDSREFARAFRAALAPGFLQTFDAARLKKVLQQLCRKEIIEMTTHGRGRTPARYRVLPRG